MSGHEAGTVVSADLSILATYVEAGVRGVCMPALLPSDGFWPVYRSPLGPTREKLQILQLDRQNHQAFPPFSPLKVFSLARRCWTGARTLFGVLGAGAALYWSS